MYYAISNLSLENEKNKAIIAIFLKITSVNVTNPEGVYLNEIMNDWQKNLLKNEDLDRNINI